MINPWRKFFGVDLENTYPFIMVVKADWCWCGWRDIILYSISVSYIAFEIIPLVDGSIEADLL